VVVVVLAVMLPVAFCIIIPNIAQKAVDDAVMVIENATMSMINQNPPPDTTSLVGQIFQKTSVKNTSPFAATILATTIKFSTPPLINGLKNSSAGVFAELPSPDLAMPTGTSATNFTVPLTITNFSHFQAVAISVFLQTDDTNLVPLTIEAEPTLQVMFLKLKVKLRKELHCAFFRPSVGFTSEDDDDAAASTTTTSTTTIQYMAPMSITCVPAGMKPDTNTTSKPKSHLEDIIA